VTATATAPATTTGVKQLDLAIGDAPKWLSDAAVDAAVNYVMVTAAGDDTPEMGDRYDELANWLNGETSMTADRVQEDVGMICSAPSAACKPH
jgi:hypothetical protein